MPNRLRRDTFRASFQFPPGYAAQLREAKEILEELAPADLTVEVEHNGEDVVVEALRVAA